MMAHHWGEGIMSQHNFEKAVAALQHYERGRLQLFKHGDGDNA